MQKFGFRLGCGTDSGVEPTPPFRGLYACVTRELPAGGPSGGWQPQEKISLDDCIRAYTTGSAYGEFMEGKKGELKEGDFAGLLVRSYYLRNIGSRISARTKFRRKDAGSYTPNAPSPGPHF